MDTQAPLDAYLKTLVKAVVAEVLAEVGTTQPLRLYDVEAAAQMLSVPQRWLYERTAADAIPHRHVGKYVRFTDADLREIARCK